MSFTSIISLQQQRVEIIAIVCPVLEECKAEEKNQDYFNKSLEVSSISKTIFCPSVSPETPVTIRPTVFPITQHPHS